MQRINGSIERRGAQPGDSEVIDLRAATGAQGWVPTAGSFSGPEAAALADITYRQLDYWARRRWVVPSSTSSGGVQRRVYTGADVVRLAALGHLGRSRVDVATYGRATGRLQLPADLRFLVVWPIHDGTVVLTTAVDLRRVTSSPGRYVIFDPAPVLCALERRQSAAHVPRPRRRTFSAEYKLAVLSEYERLTRPGAKGELLRREGLHTSHLVGWRRRREVGDLRGPALTAADIGRHGNGHGRVLDQPA